MASFLDKIKVNTAIDNRNKLDLGCDHITSANFMQYNVAWCKELKLYKRHILMLIFMLQQLMKD